MTYTFPTIQSHPVRRTFGGKLRKDREPDQWWESKVPDLAERQLQLMALRKHKRLHPSIRPFICPRTAEAT